jgi:hypothetical protein
MPATATVSPVLGSTTGNVIKNNATAANTDKTVDNIKDTSAAPMTKTQKVKFKKQEKIEKAARAKALRDEKKKPQQPDSAVAAKMSTELAADSNGLAAESTSSSSDSAGASTPPHDDEDSASTASTESEKFDIVPADDSAKTDMAHQIRKLQEKKYLSSIVKPANALRKHKPVKKGRTPLDESAKRDHTIKNPAAHAFINSMDDIISNKKRAPRQKPVKISDEIERLAAVALGKDKESADAATNNSNLDIETPSGSEDSIKISEKVESADELMNSSPIVDDLPTAMPGVINMDIADSLNETTVMPDAEVEDSETTDLSTATIDEKDIAMGHVDTDCLVSIDEVLPTIEDVSAPVETINEQASEVVANQSSLVAELPSFALAFLSLPNSMQYPSFLSRDEELALISAHVTPLSLPVPPKKASRAENKAAKAMKQQSAPVIIVDEPEIDLAFADAPSTDELQPEEANVSPPVIEEPVPSGEQATLPTDLTLEQVITDASLLADPEQIILADTDNYVADKTALPTITEPETSVSVDDVTLNADLASDGEIVTREDPPNTAAEVDLGPELEDEVVLSDEPTVLIETVSSSSDSEQSRGRRRKVSGSLKSPTSSRSSKASITAEVAAQADRLVRELHKARNTFLSTISLEDFIETLEFDADNATTSKDDICNAFATLAAEDMENITGRRQEKLPTQFDPVTTRQIVIGTVTLAAFLGRLNFNIEDNALLVSVIRAFRKAARESQGSHVPSAKLATYLRTIHRTKQSRAGSARTTASDQSPNGSGASSSADGGNESYIPSRCLFFC